MGKIRRDAWKIIRDAIKNRLGHVLVGGIGESVIKEAAKSMVVDIKAEIESPLLHIIDGQNVRLSQLSADIKALREALGLLINAKNEKERMGKSKLYIEMKEVAWAEARKTLAATDPNRVIGE